MYFNLISYFVIFVFGLSIGSFLNSIIYRLKTEESFLKGRSHCPHCKHDLGWQDLIPILSFIILKGKCRYCQKPIFLQYPLVELATGILFLLIVFHFSSNFLFSIFYLLISCFLIIIFVYDLKYYIIPDKVIYPTILVSGIWYFLSGIFLNFYTQQEIINAIYSAFGAASFFLIIVLVSRGRWMGIGDIKLAFFMGLFLSFPGILIALFSAFLVGAVLGLWLVAFGKKTMKSEVPFGPFLITGTFIALFFSQSLINWYWNLFLI
jgi:leader peptidase (prepilin peptidase)/N-methyltransferase